VLFLTKPIIGIVEGLDPGNIGRQIANTHTIFNIANVFIQLPFSFMLVKIAMWLIPDKGEEAENKVTLYLDHRILETPTIALNSTIKETLHMAYVVKEAFETAMKGLLGSDEKLANKTLELEEVINTLETDITDYLVLLSNKEIGEDERVIVDSLFNNVNDIERVGDHAEDIAQLTLHSISKRLTYSGDAKAELIEMYERTLSTFELAIEAMETGKKEAAYKAISLEGEIDELEKKCRRGHIHRLNNQECTTESGITYLEVVSNLERISDLSAKIARVVVEVGMV
jgi:phosphate:Na+ symporter